jgi:hypothetical protein
MGTLIVTRLLLYQKRQNHTAINNMNEPKDISTEIKRRYTWPDGATVEIHKPVSLIVSNNGHRIADADGNGHYVPFGWIHLFWENQKGASPIVA